jgi:endonuclease YncB( thermonuclease family)
MFSQYVNVETSKKDRYCRDIGVVTLSNKVILNEALLKNGYAWHYPEYDSSAIWSEFEASAKANKLRLWVDSDPIAPWLWRKMKK